MKTKNIRLISTGGTIACKPTPQGLSPELCALDMLRIIGADLNLITATDLCSMDSSNIAPSDWIKIAAELRLTAQNPDIDGIVLTHGTDTMAYSASMLSYLLRDARVPIVITGAQTPIINENSDGRKNLRDALTCAASLERGVYVCFGSKCMLGCRAVKTHTLSDYAFESINSPYIAKIENNRFVPLCKPYRDSAIDRFDMKNELCPDVALIKLIPGTSPKLLEMLYDCKMKGVVVESFGLGGVHSDHNDALIGLMKKGVSVVLTSQCLYEAASLEVYAVSRALHEAGAISAADMTTEATVTKLMWALAQDKYSVSEIFAHNFCGERD